MLGRGDDFDWPWWAEEILEGRETFTDVVESTGVDAAVVEAELILASVTPPDRGEQG